MPALYSPPRAVPVAITSTSPPSYEPVRRSPVFPRCRFDGLHQLGRGHDVGAFPSAFERARNRRRNHRLVLYGKHLPQLQRRAAHAAQRHRQPLGVGLCQKHTVAREQKKCGSPSGRGRSRLSRLTSASKKTQTSTDVSGLRGSRATTMCETRRLSSYRRRRAARVARTRPRSPRRGRRRAARTPSRARAGMRARPPPGVALSSARRVARIRLGGRARRRRRRPRRVVRALDLASVASVVDSATKDAAELMARTRATPTRSAALDASPGRLSSPRRARRASTPPVSTISATAFSSLDARGPRVAAALRATPSAPRGDAPARKRGPTSRVEARASRADAKWSARATTRRVVDESRQVRHDSKFVARGNSQKCFIHSRRWRLSSHSLFNGRALLRALALFFFARRDNPFTTRLLHPTYNTFVLSPRPRTA